MPTVELKEPAGQDIHWRADDAPVTDEKRRAGQSRHVSTVVEAKIEEYVPAIQAIQFAAEGRADVFDHVPAGQAEQREDEEADQNPALHTSHVDNAVAPVIFEKNPASHAVQRSRAGTPKTDDQVPAGQLRQARADVALNDEDQVPAAQRLHDIELGADQDPGAHAVHAEFEEAPSTLDQYPALQL